MSLAGSLATWQAQDAINSGHTVLLEVFVGLVAFALLVQAVAVVAMAFGAVKAQKAIMAEVTQIKGKLMPLIEKSHGLVNDLAPEIKLITTKVHDITQKIDLITAHVEDIAGLAKDKAHEFAPTISAANVTIGEANETVKDANQKTRRQVARVNGMISSTLDATAQIGRAIERGITAPGREIAGIVNGAKATIEMFLHRSRESRGPKGPGGSVPRPSAYPGPRPEGSRPGYPVSAGVAPAKSSAEATAAVATAAFAKAEKPDLGL